MTDTLELVEDRDGIIAVIPNSRTVASWLGYLDNDPANTPVEYMLLSCGPQGQEFWVGDGMFGSATFADEMCGRAGCDHIPITADVIAHMEKHMGATVMREAQEEGKHPFVRAMLRFYKMGGAEGELRIRRKEFRTVYGERAA